MKQHILECAIAFSPDAFWALYVHVVQPGERATFGHSLDAFSYALSGGPGWPGRCEIRILNWQELRAFNNGQFYTALCDIIATQSDVRFVWEGA